MIHSIFKIFFRASLCSILLAVAFCQPFSAAAGADQSDGGMVARWRFDEMDDDSMTPCDILDDQKAEIVRSNRVTGEFNARFEDGVLGKSFYCGGGPGQFGYYAVVDSPPSLEDEFTIAFWINPRTSQWMTQVVYYKRGWAHDAGFMLEIGGTELSLMLGSSREKKMASEIALTMGQWAFIALSWDGRLWRMYNNGMLAAESNKDAHPGFIHPGADVPLNLGGYNVNTNNIYQGLIDEFRIWDRALTVEEIRNVMVRDLSR